MALTVTTQDLLLLLLCLLLFDPVDQVLAVGQSSQWQ
jgi:hypothetical protein